MYNVRVRRPAEQEKIYNELTNKQEFGIFETYKDLFMLSLMIGFLEGGRKTFKDSMEAINWQVFNSPTDELVINMIAYLEREDLSLIYEPTEENFRRKIKIAEEYAAVGAEKVYQVIMKDQKNGLRELIDYLQEFESVTDMEELRKKRLKEDLNL